ncbi:hypothetical protein A3A39_00415 [Candidatus Kaiserbacteria bacterium RIFCSPLOWO2_01_FULL_54_13]|uniref:Uncharacterized protein n=1 Tax=Candidatus Kaiserbacteria bacterium RIFCSPLOWO2_01_FULL_54_13 TaxID=1798512 RepID=A0A1F6F0N0_9BACT|nr:MAG: hypothetical protein A3A39_00415 [Candidatus Kaiserbacteria bacterium RIFCSPLOWO2_01_FULL_54_13]
MTRFLDREKARTLRAQGKSYSEIKSTLGVSKGTLSEWLKDMPLAPEQIRRLRDLNPKRIEHFRETMRNKRESRLHTAYERAKRDVGRLSRRDAFIAGLYLYWGEGTKSARGKTEITNTDPYVLVAFLQWLEMLGVSRRGISVRLTLYTDMNVQQETRFWSRMLQVSSKQFRKPHIKRSALVGLSRKSGYGHGTCSVIFDNVPMWEYISMALKRLREMHSRP